MSQGIMDYSLLLVTEIIPEYKSSTGQTSIVKTNYGRNSYISLDKKEACHFGIIDYL